MFAESEIYRFIAIGVTVALVNLSVIFTQLEKVTDDHCNKRDA